MTAGRAEGLNDVGQAFIAWNMFRRKIGGRAKSELPAERSIGMTEARLRNGSYAEPSGTDSLPPLPGWIPDTH